MTLLVFVASKDILNNRIFGDVYILLGYAPNILGEPNYICPFHHQAWLQFKIV